MRKKIEKIRLAFLTDWSVDDIVSKHIEIVTRPKYDVDDTKAVTTEGAFPPCGVVLKVAEEGKKAPRKTILRPKYQFLIHEIIMKCRASKEGSVQLNYVSHVELLGKVYSDMLYVLSELRIIYLSQSYTIGKESRVIELRDWNFDFEDCINQKVIEYIKKNDVQFLEYNERHILKGGIYDEGFVEQYNRCLSYLELSDRKDAVDYIANKDFKKFRSFQYYISKIEDFDKRFNRILQIDNNGRIYHHLTNCPKDLKRFFNIRYSLDIHNSHPLLFSYFLIKEHKISYNIIEILNNIQIDIIDNITNIHYLGKELCKRLNNNKLDVPNDIIFYIFLTMKGKLWDVLCVLFDSIDRDILKKEMFAQVFYSKRHSIVKRPFAKVFSEVFPNVWEYIGVLKKDGAENLPNQMMALESRLFHDILNICWNRGWCVVNIHDAVVVLDVPQNLDKDVSEVEAIMVGVYRDNGLIPNVGLEKYG